MTLLITNLIHYLIEFEKFTNKKFIAFEELPVSSTDKIIKAETKSEIKTEIKTKTKTKTETIKAETKTKAKAPRKATAKPATKTKAKTSKTTIENDDINNYNDDVNVTVTTVVTKRGRSCTVKNYNDNDDDDFDEDQDNVNDNDDYDDYDNYGKKGKPKKAKATKQNISKPKIEAAIPAPIELKKTLQQSKSIEQLHITTGEVLHIYYQCKDAATAMGLAQCTITSCCNGKIKDYGGFRWRFYTGPEVTLEEVSHTLTPISDLLSMKVTKEKRKYSEIDNSTNKEPKLDNNTNNTSTINTPISVTVPAVITVYKNADISPCANTTKSPVKLVNGKIDNVNTSNQSSSFSVANTNGRSPVKVVSIDNLSNGNNNVKSSALEVNAVLKPNLNATNIPIMNAIPTNTPIIFDLTNDSDDDENDNSVFLTTSLIDLTAAKPVVTKVTSKVKKTENTNIIRNLYSWFSTKKN